MQKAEGRNPVIGLFLEVESIKRQIHTLEPHEILALDRKISNTLSAGEDLQHAFRQTLHTWSTALLCLPRSSRSASSCRRSSMVQPISYDAAWLALYSLKTPSITMASSTLLEMSAALQVSSAIAQAYPKDFKKRLSPLSLHSSKCVSQERMAMQARHLPSSLN